MNYPPLGRLETNAIIKDYKKKHIEKLQLVYKGRGFKGEPVFEVYFEEDGESGKSYKFKETYVVTKVDLSKYSKLSIIDLPVKRSLSVISNDKRYVINWLNSKIGLNLISSDISNLLVKDNELVIITNPSSNRFCNNLILNII